MKKRIYRKMMHIEYQDFDVEEGQDVSKLKYNDGDWNVTDSGYIIDWLIDDDLTTKKGNDFFIKANLKALEEG